MDSILKSGKFIDGKNPTAKIGYGTLPYSRNRAALGVQNSHRIGKEPGEARRQSHANLNAYLCRIAPRRLWFARAR
jgi:hypothetical protein